MIKPLGGIHPIASLLASEPTKEGSFLTLRWLRAPLDTVPWRPDDSPNARKKTPTGAEQSTAGLANNQIAVFLAHLNQPHSDRLTNASLYL